MHRKILHLNQAKGGKNSKEYPSTPSRSLSAFEMLKLLFKLAKLKMAENNLLLDSLFQFRVDIFAVKFVGKQQLTVS